MSIGIGRQPGMSFRAAALPSSMKAGMLAAETALDSFAPHGEAKTYPPRADVEVPGRSIVLLRRDF